MPSARDLFGKKIRELRTHHGLSQEKLAEMCAVHRNYIGRLERSEVNITFDSIMKVAGGLKVKPELLFRLVPKQPLPVAEAKGKKSKEL